MIEPVSVPILLDLELSEEEYELTAEELEEINLQLKSIISINQVYGGLPSGGEQGDIIIKKSNQDYDAEWVPLTALDINDIEWISGSIKVGNIITPSKTLSEIGTAFTLGKNPIIKLLIDGKVIELPLLYYKSGWTGALFGCVIETVFYAVEAAKLLNREIWRLVETNLAGIDYAEVFYLNAEQTQTEISDNCYVVEFDDPQFVEPDGEEAIASKIITEYEKGRNVCIKYSTDGVLYHLRPIVLDSQVISFGVFEDGFLIYLSYNSRRQSGSKWRVQYNNYTNSDSIDAALEEKVDKEVGKGLSTNDYTTAEKDKLAGIAAGAQVNAVEGISIDNGSTTLTPDANKNIILPTAGYGSNGLMSQSDFIKLQGISDGAEINVIDSIRVNGSEVSVENKTVDITVPTTVAELTDAADYVTDTEFQETISSSMSTVSAALALKADASAVYTKTEVDQKLVGAMNYKGTKATVADLPSSGNKKGDMWHVTATGGEYAWNGSAWEEMGSVIDLSGYVEEDDIGIATTSQIDELFGTSGS